MIGSKGRSRAGQFLTASVLAAAAWLAPQQAALGAMVSLNTDNASGEDWSTAGRWSDGAGASAGNDYFVGNSTPGAVRIVRSPNNGTAVTFPGDSLELDVG